MTTYRVLSDQLYRSVAITTTGNVIAEAYDTDAYGNTLCYSGPGADGEWFTDDDTRTNSPINTTIFTGRQYDPESQIYYYRARYYSPNIGRFISRDPLAGAEVTQGPNLYWYVQDNPANTKDASGLGHRPPISGGSSEGDGDPSDLADLLAAYLSDVSYGWALQNAENGCGPSTGHPNCNCCVITLHYLDFADHKLYDWKNSSGYLANQSCADVENQDNKSGILTASGEVEIQYIPW